LRSVQKNIYWLSISAGLIVILIYANILHSSAQIGRGIALNDSIYTVGLEALSLWGIVRLIKSYPTTVFALLYAFVIATVITSISTLADWQILKWTPVNNAGYILWLRHTLFERFFITWLFIGMVARPVAQQKKIKTLENKFQRQTDATVMLRDAELFKLRQQLQPHFLYNSLNSISALIMIAPDRAQDMVGKLSDFLRSSVKREAQDKIPIADELTYIQSYLAIESIRFGDRLHVQFENEYTDSATVPPFLIQPVLENAIKFGLYARTGAVTITIHIVLQAPLLTITVTNPYDPQTRPLRGTGFGLEGIQRRLYLLYARADLLEVKKDDTTFTTILKIPQAYV
jgi:two-component system LytT family sensor kinase